MRGAMTMIKDTFSNRLKKALDMNNIKPVKLSELTGLDKSLISNYLSGNYKAKQDNLSKMADVLNVSETWLMRYDVPINNTYDDIIKLYNEHKEKLTKEDKNKIKEIITNRIKK